MPLAICSRPACDHRIELQDPKNGTSVPTPTVCPRCEAPMISLCPECGFLLVGLVKEKHPLCAICKADIRQVFAQIVFNLHRPQWKGSRQSSLLRECLPIPEPRPVQSCEPPARKPREFRPREFKSIEQIDAAIGKLRQRIEELENLDVRSAVANDSEAVSVARRHVQDTIHSVFGLNSLEYWEHRGIDIWVGPLRMGMSDPDLIQAREQGRIQVIGILKGLIGRLEERKGFGGSPSSRNEKARLHEDKSAFQIGTQPRETVPFRE